jgi:hypothetical protein
MSLIKSAYSTCPNVSGLADAEIDPRGSDVPWTLRCSEMQFLPDCSRIAGPSRGERLSRV